MRFRQVQRFILVEKYSGLGALLFFTVIYMSPPGWLGGISKTERGMIFTHSLTPFQSLPLKHSPLSILLLQWTVTSHPGLVGVNAVRHAERVLKEEPDPVPIPRQADVENLVKVAMKNF